MNTFIPAGLTAYKLQAGSVYRFFVVVRGGIDDTKVMAAINGIGFMISDYWITGAVFPVDWPDESNIYSPGSGERVVHVSGVWSKSGEMPTSTAGGNVIVFGVWLYTPDATTAPQEPGRVVDVAADFPEMFAPQPARTFSTAAVAPPTADDALYPLIAQWSAGQRLDPSWMLLVLYLESRLNPNPPGNPGYAGLSQLDASYLRNTLGIDPTAYRGWKASEQFARVIAPWYSSAIKTYLGRTPRSQGTLYALNIAPGRVKSQGDAPQAVMYSAPTKQYQRNSNLDVDHSGTITIGDFDAFMVKLAKEAPFRAALTKLQQVAPSAGAATAPNPGSGTGAAVLWTAGLLGASGLVLYGAHKFAEHSTRTVRHNPIPDKRVLIIGGGLLVLAVTPTIVSALRGKAAAEKGQGNSSTPSSLGQAAVIAAQKDIGLVESAPNSGPRIMQMLANVGVTVPANWCAAAVSTWIMEGAKMLGVTPRVRGSASVLALMKQFQAIDAFIDLAALRANPKRLAPGMIAIWSRGGTNSGLGHTGIVESVDDMGGFTTIEGNAGPNADRVIESKHDLGSTTMLGVGFLTFTRPAGVGYWNDPPGAELFERRT